MSEDIGKLVGRLVHEGALQQATDEALVMELCRRLAAGKVARDPYDPDNEEDEHGELETAGAARSYCHRLLAAANAWGAYGCRLCRS